MNATVFGYEWEAIKRAQQGGKLSANLPKLKTATVQCFRCEKYFPLPDMSQEEPYPVQCTRCGYAHTFSNAKEAQWPGA